MTKYADSVAPLLRFMDKILKKPKSFNKALDDAVEEIENIISTKSVQRAVDEVDEMFEAIMVRGENEVAYHQRRMNELREELNEQEARRPINE